MPIQRALSWSSTCVQAVQGGHQVVGHLAQDGCLVDPARRYLSSCSGSQRLILGFRLCCSTLFLLDIHHKQLAWIKLLWLVIVVYLWILCLRLASEVATMVTVMFYEIQALGHLQDVLCSPSFLHVRCLWLTCRPTLVREFSK